MTTSPSKRYELKVKSYAFLFISFLLIGLALEHGIQIQVPEWNVINPNYEIISGTVISFITSFTFLILLYRLGNTQVIEEVSQ